MNDYNTQCVNIVEDYILHLNRDIMMGKCQAVAETFSMDDTEVLNDVDSLFIEEYGDIY